MDDLGNNLNVIKSRRHVNNAEYIEIKVTTQDRVIIVVNCYCPSDRMLTFDAI